MKYECRIVRIHDVDHKDEWSTIYASCPGQAAERLVEEYEDEASECDVGNGNSEAIVDVCVNGITRFTVSGHVDVVYDAKEIE